ncbi:MAG: ABC transporter ATP-binding protein [Candidatus Latescibacteria bacterium]|nr:ABC transporter ATP-binding protein [Candidatus Latescibacterota bacterium]
MIKTVNLQKVYTTEEVETTALNNVNVEINEGEFVAIMGPSGCGKSTLLNVVGLLDNPTGGEFYLNGEEVSKHTERMRANTRKENIGFVFQSFNLIDELTVGENVELPLLYLGMPSSERKKRVDESLEYMGIKHREKHFPQQLSGGQQQRVAVARAVISNPNIILADEPTGNLDSSNGNEVMDLLTELNKSGTTIIMVTHNSHDAGYAHRVIHLFDGHVVTENIKEQTQN